MSLLNVTIRLGATFYLLYHLHYQKQQLIAAYPRIQGWLLLKKQLDPNQVWDSQFFHYIQKVTES